MNVMDFFSRRFGTELEGPKENNGIHEIEPPLLMIYNGFSQHDCEGHWRCPKCNRDYGDWGFFNKDLRVKIPLYVNVELI